MEHEHDVTAESSSSLQLLALLKDALVVPDHTEGVSD